MTKNKKSCYNFISNDYLSRHVASREDNTKEKTDRDRFQDHDVSSLMAGAFFLPSRELNDK